MSKFKAGDKLIRTKGSYGGMRIGDIGTFERYKYSDSSSTIIIKEFNPRGDTGHDGNCFRLVEELNKGEVKVSNLEVGQVIDINEVFVKLENRSYPDEKVGTKYAVIDPKLFGWSTGVKKGEVVELERNDGSSCPSFRFGGATKYANWDGLAKIPENYGNKAAKAPKPEVQSTKTVYSDGVEVSEEQLTFDGQTISREDLKARVKRYQEVLRRPVASIPTLTKKPAARKKTTAKKA